MNVLKRLAGFFASNKPVETVSTAARHGRFGMRMYAPASEIDYTRYIGRFRDNGIVAMLHAHIARSVNQARIYVADRDGAEVKEHDIYRLFQSPSEDYSWQDLTSAWLMDLMTSGNAYGNVAPGMLTGAPMLVQFLPTTRTSPISVDPAFVRLVTHYDYRSPNGKTATIAKAQVIHARMGIDPDDQAKGISPLASLVREVVSDNLAARYTAAVLLNFGSPSLFITPETGALDIDPSGWEDAVEDMASRINGDNAGSVLAPNFPARLTEVGNTPDDMALDKIWSTVVSRICAAFGADPMVLGMPSANKTYSNLAEAQDATWHNCSAPLLDLIVRAVERTVLHGMYGDRQLHLAVDTSGVTALMDDTLKEAEAWGNLYVNGVVTRADARLKIGLDATPEDDVYYSDAIMGTPSQTDTAAVRKAAHLAKTRRAMLETGELEPDPEE